MIKLLVPIGAFHPSKSGGPSKTVFWHVNHLDDTCFESTVVTTDYKLEDESIILSEWHKRSFGIIRFQKTRGILFPINFVYHSLLQLRKTDIVHLNGGNYPPMFIIAFFAKLFGKPTIWSIRGALETNALNSKKGTLKKILLKTMRFLFRQNVYFHATSNKEKTNIESSLNPTKKIILLPNYFPKQETIRIEKRLEIIYLGRLHPFKGIKKLIDSFVSSQYKSARYKLIIVGADKNEYAIKLKEQYSKYIDSEDICFLGRLDGKEKNKALAKASFLVLPSQSENFGNVVVESMMQGTPVIANFGSPWEILNKREAGFWIVNTAESLTKTLNKVFAMQQLDYEKMSDNALNLAKDFTLDNNIHKWENSYKNILS